MQNSYQPRAKQFSPYAALRGLDDVVASKRKISEERRELCEDEAEELSRRLSELQRGAVLTVTFYLTDRYVEKCGTVKTVDTVYRRILLEDRTEIPLDDILSVEF